MESIFVKSASINIIVSYVFVCSASVLNNSCIVISTSISIRIIMNIITISSSSSSSSSNNLA